MGIRGRDDHEPDAETGVVDPEHGDEAADDEKDHLGEHKIPGADMGEKALRNRGREEGKGAEGDDREGGMAPDVEAIVMKENSCVFWICQ